MLRELRKKHRVSAGVTVWHRDRRGLQGRSTYYSVLSALAARSRQEGHDEEAEGLERAASQLEGQFSERLELFLSHHSLAQLPQAEFFSELTAATAEGLLLLTFRGRCSNGSVLGRRRITKITAATAREEAVTAAAG